jgi:diguanylate cyclase (GGDEF)-like protein
MAVVDATSLDRALLESRGRWRDLAGLAVDLAFEIDDAGCFSFVYPDLALGWPAAALLGKPAERVLAAGRREPGFNPFRPIALHRRRTVWARRADGSLACLLLTTAPLSNAAGQIVGARGVALDITEQDGREAAMAAELRRGALLDRILDAMRREVLAPRMMQAVLDSLAPALGAEGAAVFGHGAEGEAVMLHQAGGGGAAVMAAAPSLLVRPGTEPVTEPIAANAVDGRRLMAVPCRTRFGEQAGFVLWRSPGSLPWDADDRLLAIAAGTIIRVVLEHLATQQEMSRQAQTDPLTGLLNRRAFLEEMSRRLDRLAFDGLPGTLMFVDLDRFKELNDTLGHEVGDAALLITASLLRELVRPADLIARFGGDEFAVWLDGADHRAAAERAEQLRRSAPERISPLAAGCDLPLTMSIGIATRPAHSEESLQDLLRRADAAMYVVKRQGVKRQGVKRQGVKREGIKRQGREHRRLAHREPPA